MGIFRSKGQLALDKADNIRQELHERVNRKYNKLKEQMAAISQQKKNIIKRSSASELTQFMDKGQLMSYEIVLTFIERTATIGIRNHYVIDQMFEEAIIQSKQCDYIRSENPNKKCWRMGDSLQNTFPPFYGVPVSLKQSILYKDRVTWVGHVNIVNPIPNQHLLFVQILLRMGFIPFVRSTIPPCAKIIDTVSNIFPHCVNGWMDGRSCGGSSGGEGGLIGSGCSPFGFGTDIGGSARIPAQWNGLCALKPAYRYTALGNAYYGKYAAGAPTKAEICPMTRSVQDLIIFSQFIFDSNNYGYIAPYRRDIYLKQLPFDSGAFKEGSKLTIGYFSGIKNVYRSSLAHERVLKESVELLRRRGHRVKQIQIPGLQELFLYFMRNYASDSTLDTLEQVRQDEPPIKQYKLYYFLAKTPWFLKVILSWIIQKKQPRMSKLMKMTKPMSGVEAVQQIYNNTKVRQKILYQYLVEQGVDVWICPGFPVPAIQHGTVGDFTYLVSCTAIWNAIHYPAGVVPVSVVKEGELDYEDGINDSLTRRVRKSMMGAVGLPIGVQVISYPNNDEQILYIMKEIQEQTRFRQIYESKAMQN